MKLLANAFLGKEVYTAPGAALGIHEHWNEHSISTDIIKVSRKK
ncbi:hypothetical protein BH20BAC1_BH20BAC1_21550 [soil metagenome]